MNLHELISNIVVDNELHARWLNTLSFLENTGARKISAGEHKRTVSLMVLKHAAEEHRHAYYLKRQIAKLGEEFCPTYESAYLVVPNESCSYLDMLDVAICRYLKSSMDLAGDELKYAAYLLVTYAIEVRADELYPVYQRALDEVGSRVNVKSIIAEEEGHLDEMVLQLTAFSADWEHHASKAIEIESGLFERWLTALATYQTIPADVAE